METSQQSFTLAKRVSVHERAFTVGRVTGINGYRVNTSLLKRRFAEGGYSAQETPHFFLFTRSQAPSTILVHRFAPEEIDATIGDYFIKELKPIGLLAHPKDFGDVFGAVVFSVCPSEPQKALRLYARNTLQKYHSLLTSETEIPVSSSAIHAFANVYRRVFELHEGKSFLEAGCSFGFLPLLMSECFPELSKSIGVDIASDPFPVISALAHEKQLANVKFIQADLLEGEFARIGQFDTVTALHVLEHFTEGDMYLVLTNLLKVTSRLLIIAVPYEVEEPEKAYGHKQLFTRTKLRAVGDWCLECLAGRGKIAYEDCAGGLLIVERIRA